MNRDFKPSSRIGARSCHLKIGKQVMCQKYLIIIVLVCAINHYLFLQNVTCLKLITTNSDRRSSFQLDRSGWQTLNLSIASTTDQPPEHDHDHDHVMKIQKWHQTNSTPREASTSRPPPSVTKKPVVVQWDDDELLNDYQGESERIGPKQVGEELQHLEEPQDGGGGVRVWKGRRVSDWSGENGSGKYRKMSGKLIYHGQVAKNGSTKIIDGVRLHINVHEPVAINRRHAIATRRQLEDAADIKEGRGGSQDQEKSFKRIEGVKPRHHRESTGGSSRHQLEELPSKSSGSEWKPIIMMASDCANCEANNKSRPSKAILSKLEQQGPMRSIDTSYKIMVDDSSLQAEVATATSNHKWKPIKKELDDSRMWQDADIDRDNDDREPPLKSTLVSAGRSHGAASLIDNSSDSDHHQQHQQQQQQQQQQEHNEDFDGSFQRRTESGTKLLVNETGTHKPVDNLHWTPVDTTTESSSASSPAASRNRPLPQLQGGGSLSASNATNSNGTLDFAQKSASDLNYIYSPQQTQTPSRSEWFMGTRSASPYFGYQQQSSSFSANELQANQQYGGSSSAIVDTSSGQFPEMIPDRDASSSVLGGMPELTQTVSLQPLTRPYPYDPSSYYARPQQAPRVAPQTTVAPVIRQEHHYHYYGQQQGPERLQQPQQQQQQQTSQVIRELQPLFISQPVIQQQVASSTAAPQIIREIIKEVPAQSMQIYGPHLTSRIVIPQPAPIRSELDSSIGYNSAYYPSPGQRIIRQLSAGNIPSAVAARIPQIRLPIPTMQIPARLGQATSAAGITRQTGSFIIPPVPQKTTTFLTETQAMPTHTTIMHTTQFTPATRTTVYTTDHQAAPKALAGPATAYKR